MADLSSFLAALLGSDMSDDVFPSFAGQDIAIVREPMHRTAVQESLSGKEIRYSWWSYPRYRYTLKFNAVRSTATLAEFQSLFGFFSMRAGQLDSFLWQDPEDNAVVAQPFGVGLGGTVAFQLQRTLMPDSWLPAVADRLYWPGFGNGYEPVFDLDGDPVIQIDGLTTTAYTISGGIVTFTSPPSAGAILSWTGSWFRRVRFDADNLPATRIVSKWWAVSVGLISVKA